MKRFLIPIAVLILVGCRHKEVTGLEGKLMPSFDLLLPDSITHLNTNNIPIGKPVVLFYFGPYCPYSRAEMEDIISNIDKLKSLHFYIFTSFPFQDMKKFYDYYKLNNYPNITIGTDTANYFGRYYKAPGYPFLAIYDKKKHLKEAILGKSDIDLIKNIALE
jgi:thiol-disulfide isomerase/thioredoxin